ncbi:ras guanine nucleotide exchange factor i-related [Anaeramoeba flamelloides]|uniref:Ras guanine nucleotide exchange factor i-related n=1 Tax=Anaeramoeba flamelloides TaxID=1746091 RepID=A0ABQ8YC00_9EUKA|nr:ras guanine nucleotide exchange factor i-related [Anaeramoeba flamelloides]
MSFPNKKPTHNDKNKSKQTRNFHLKPWSKKNSTNEKKDPNQKEKKPEGKENNKKTPNQNTVAKRFTLGLKTRTGVVNKTNEKKKIQSLHSRHYTQSNTKTQKNPNQSTKTKINKNKTTNNKKNIKTTNSNSTSANGKSVKPSTKKENQKKKNKFSTQTKKKEENSKKEKKPQLPPRILQKKMMEKKQRSPNKKNSVAQEKQKPKQKQKQKEKEKEKEKNDLKKITQRKTTTTATKNFSSKEQQNEGEILLSKKLWLSYMMKTSPELVEFHERITPFSKRTSFGQLYKRGLTESKEQISGDPMTLLILNYLENKGLKKTVNSLVSESKIKVKNHYSSQDQLTTLLKMVIKDVQNIWDLNLEKCATIPPIINQDQVEVTNKQSFLLGKEDNFDKIDFNIWDELPDCEDNFLPPTNDENQCPVKAGTLNKLIEKLTSAKVSPRFLYVFLMTYQSFTTPWKLLYKLFQRFDVPNKVHERFDTQKEFENYKKIVQVKTINVIKTWLDRHFSDFSEGLLEELKQWISNEELKNQKNKALLNQIRSTIKYKGEKHRIETSTQEIPEPKVPKNIFSPTLSIFDIDEIEVARQITLIDFEMFSQIKPAELLNCAWSKPRLKHRAKNILRLIERFNNLSNYLIHLILEKERVKQRVKAIQKIINIAEALYNLNNFNSLNSVLSALASSAVHRLSFTFNELPNKHLEVLNNLKEFMKGDSSYKNYRESLKAINPPCIPFMGIYLTDLTFIEDGNPDRVNGKLINFLKRVMIYDSIETIQRFQYKKYHLHPVHQISILLRDFDIYDKNEEYATSLLREPRNALQSEIKF